MPRTARKYISSEFLHVIIAGNGKQIIFEEEKDYRFFKNLLLSYAREHKEITLIGFCLMETHVHFLFKVRIEHLSKMMSCLETTYAIYFNKKYKKSGHLFQDRFKTGSIDNEKYLLRAYRYILQNPVKAGICPAEDYKWSSYFYYGKNSQDVDTSIIESYIGSFDNHVKFINNKEKQYIFEFDPFRNNDKLAKAYVHDLFGVKSTLDIKEFSKNKRNNAIVVMKRNGMSIRQISRLTGIGKGIIQAI